jgi:hypothetical protein
MVKASTAIKPKIGTSLAKIANPRVSSSQLSW